MLPVRVGIRRTSLFALMQIVLCTHTATAICRKKWDERQCAQFVGIASSVVEKAGVKCAPALPAQSVPYGLFASAAHRKHGGVLKTAKQLRNRCCFRVFPANNNTVYLLAHRSLLPSPLGRPSQAASCSTCFSFFLFVSSGWETSPLRFAL